MYSEFAYSRAMQLILAVIAFVSSYIFVYLIANLMSQFFGEKSSVKQKSIFAFLLGVMLNQVWVYLVYFIGGMQSFSEIKYTLIVTPNPIFALFYYIVGVKVLNLSALRSIKLMGHIYLYYIIIKSLSRLIGSVFFIQSPGRYNYMLDAINQIIFMAVFLTVYFGTKYMLRHYKQVIKLTDSLFINFKKELAIYFLKSLGIYLVIVGLTLIFKEKVAANFVIFTILVLIFIINILLDINQDAKNYVENRDVYINAISRDFLPKLEEDISKLKNKLNLNPSLISILLNKYDYAEKQEVKMRITLQGNIKNFNIDNIDVCKIISCLLDNAIDSAANYEHKWVHFTIESKENNGNLIVVNNSLDMTYNINKKMLYEQNENLSAIGKIIRKYGNCIFQISYHTNEMRMYLEIR